jgi:hypothetical protein
MYIKIILLTFVLITGSADNEGWKLRKEESGISIYTRKVQNSSFEQFKGVVSITNTSLTEVLDVIIDINNYTSLFPDCIEAKVLRKQGKYYDIHYVRMRAPWPVKDRDAVYESATTISVDGKYAKVLLKPVSSYSDERKDIVRIRKGTGYWELEEDAGNNVKVIYVFHADPGGNIPAWLVNSIVVENPFKTLINLKTKLHDIKAEK